MKAADLILGVDGGQSRTRYLLSTLDGDVVVFAEGEPCAALIQPARRDSVWRMFEREVRTVLRLAGCRTESAVGAGAPMPRAVCLGISGVPDPGSAAAQLWKTTLADRLGWHEGREGFSLLVDNDMVSALAGAACLGPGVVVLSGSGSVAYGRNPSGVSARAGGWGYLLGDEGSGFSIGLQGVKAAIAAWDGDGPSAALDLASGYFGRFGIRDISELKFAVYSGAVTTGDLARFAEAVSGAADSGQAWAAAILRRAGQDLGHLAAIVLGRLVEPGWSPVVFGLGRVLENCGPVAVAMTESLAARFPGIGFRRPELPPVAGSVLLATACVDGAAASRVAERLKATLKSAGPPLALGATAAGQRVHRWTPAEIAGRLKGKLVASVQAQPGDRTEDPEVLAAMVEAVVAGGAAGVRVNGPKVVSLARTRVDVPVLGINKVGADSYDVYITPSLDAAAEVIEAGADMVAVDATVRPRPDGSSAAELISGILKGFPGVAVVADVSTVEEAVAAERCGAHFVATTLAGYTPYSRHLPGCDLELVRQVSQAVGVPVIAEGRVRTPNEAALALDAGAWAVVVGSAITRPRAITEEFVRAIQARPGSAVGAQSTGVGGRCER